jgi:ABC-type cobalamin/Fe3+-siderophores transport system ATPase subunit
MAADKDVSCFARTNHRNTSVPFGIKQADRLSHMCVIGETGVGKSTLFKGSHRGASRQEEVESLRS